ncbi:hypothetical protein QQ020_13960 [Fulvivirgaceae bacterium BMA12]|uniref:Uncharacterized protein n=1 Tax=Agaribacillus aureus TaxID=3051825 RepID=A0ABT8LA75_9BACT|nr:hypothetical protein [Fulvivirgaceae bacterium BMA12]
MLEELQSIAGSVDCEDPLDWVYTPTGDKACGGPSGYLAYSIKIDTAVFLQKVEKHRKAESDYNFKWRITSDCEIHSEPIAIECEAGKAKLIYR